MKVETLESKQNLRDFIRDHEVRWNVSPLNEMLENQTVKVGFEVELVAMHAAR